MTTPDSDAAEEGDAQTARSRARRWPDVAAEAAAVALSAVIVAGLGVYGARRDVARGLAEAWLKEQGLGGAVQVDRLDADGFSGRLRIGPANDPDLLVERMEVDLGVEPAWAGEPFRLSTRAIRLVRPQLKAELGRDGLTFGRLDPVVQDFLSRPKTDDQPGPLVLVEDGLVRLRTTYGPLRLRGSAAVDDGRLVRFYGRTAPARLSGESLSADLGEGFVRLEGRGGRLTGRADLTAEELTAGGVTVQDGDAMVEIDAPYPDGSGFALEGPLIVRAALDAASAGAGEASGRGLRLRGVVQGRASGPLAEVEFNGDGEFDIQASVVDSTNLGLQQLTGRADATRLRVVRSEAGFAVEGAGQTKLTAARARSGDVFAEDSVLTVASRDIRFGEGGVTGPLSGRLQARRAAARGWETGGLTLDADAHAALLRTGGAAGLSVQGTADRLQTKLDGRTVGLRAVSARFSGPARRRQAGLEWRADGAGSARGALTEAEGAAAADRLPVLGAADSHRAEIISALQAFALRAPALDLTLQPGGGLRLAADAPIRMESRSGAVLTAAAGPVFGSAEGETRGRLQLAMSGGGLPEGTLALDGWRINARGFDSPVRLRLAGLDAAIARNATADVRGRARLSGGAFRFDAAGCFPVSAAEIEFGENDLADASARICPAGGAPLITVDDRGYRLQGAFDQAGLSAPVAEARATAASGAFTVAGAGEGLRTADVRLRAATVADQAVQTRYVPVRLSGRIGLAGGLWSGGFDVASSQGGRLAVVAVRHEDGTGRGSAEIDGRGVAFAPGALQPEQLSPLLAGIAADAQGAVDFTGRYDWTPAGVTSTGRLVTRGLNFKSPAGAVTAVNADVAFTSLTPLLSAPDQVVSISRLDAVTEVTNATTAITLTENALRLESTAFGVGGGRVSVEAFSIPLDGSGRYSGVLTAEGVQLGELIEAVNLGEQVRLDAVVDGRIPFEVSPGRVRFTQGRLAARQPGRLSISREALSGVSATGGAGTPAEEAAPVNAVQEFAYQAMENLAFQDLELSVDSLPEGRLGLLFKVRGEHDPEVAEEARVGFFEALRGRAFQRRIPLPKGTPVNLTLDTSLNFDELLQAWLDISRRRTAEATAEAERSTPVQPVPPTRPQ